MSRERIAIYQDDGYREVTQLEFTLANLVSQYNVTQIKKIVDRLAKEVSLMGRLKEVENEENH
jgi:hypothetical protein